jgi:hypothetical protein
MRDAGLILMIVSAVVLVMRLNYLQLQELLSSKDAD